MLNKKTFQMMFAAAAFMTVALANTTIASADQNKPSLSEQKVQMAMLSEMVNTSTLAALIPQENGDKLTIDAIEKQFENTAANENMVAAESDDGC